MITTFARRILRFLQITLVVAAGGVIGAPAIAQTMDQHKAKRVEAAELAAVNAVPNLGLSADGADEEQAAIREARKTESIQAAKAVVVSPPPTPKPNTVTTKTASIPVQTAAPKKLVNKPGAVQTSAPVKKAVVRKAVVTPAPSKVASVLAFARAQLGEPYILGGAGPGVWDCSGLTLVAFQNVGITIGTHSATNQYYTAKNRGLLVPYADRRAGDLIFYTDGSGDYYHVTIYSGNGMMIEAPRPGVGVREVPVRAGDRAAYVARFL